MSRNPAHTGKRLFPAILALIALVLAQGPAMAAEKALSFAVSGVVAEIAVKAGAGVAKGAVLARLDPRPFQAERQAAEARAAMTATVLEISDRRLQQTRDLFDSLSTSAEEVEKAEATAARATADDAAAKAALAIARWREERAVLVAPFAGTVARIPGYPGLIVEPAAGAAPVVVIEAP